MSSPSTAKELSPQQLRAARLLSAGLSLKETASKMGVAYGTIALWYRSPEMKEEVVRLINDHTAAMRDALLAGERAALETVMEAMTADDKDGNPDWNTRLKAAMRLLDAAGERGKPSDKLSSQHLEIKGDLDQLLARAMREPKVKAFIAEQGIIPDGEAVLLD